ncbi:hypothetical protein GCM10009716_11840 [Streptomyces sodiiphilus]|uniref:Excreted virulence factor EspC, type VII ESX diderm n=1 Tax=Streptomyces sodiiphilus TaxID=226217 RepID=A0ABN2NVC4_9ACTN
MSFLRFLNDEVRELAGKLESSGEDMSNASKSLAEADATRVGTQALARACEDFADSWDYGFGKLSELTKGVAEYADNAAEAFGLTDKELEEALRQAGQA